MPEVILDQRLELDPITSVALRYHLGVIADFAAGRLEDFEADLSDGFAVRAYTGGKYGRLDFESERELGFYSRDRVVNVRLNPDQIPILMSDSGEFGHRFVGTVAHELGHLLWEQHNAYEDTNVSHRIEEGVVAAIADRVKLSLLEYGAADSVGLWSTHLQPEHVEAIRDALFSGKYYLYSADESDNPLTLGYMEDEYVTQLVKFLDESDGWEYEVELFKAIEMVSCKIAFEMLMSGHSIEDLMAIDVETLKNHEFAVVK